MSLDVADPDRYLCLFRDLHLCDHRHGSRPFVHAQSAQGVRDVLLARCGGRSQSCHSALGLRVDAAQQRLWRSANGISCAHRRRRGYYTCSFCNSRFFASSSSLGTPTGLSCALIIRSHNSLQKAGVSLLRKPVSWIWISLIFGCRSSD